MDNAQAGRPVRFGLLLDTNAFIALEPTSTSPESGLHRAADLVRLAHEGGFPLYLADATMRDIAHDKDLARRAANFALARKYQKLEAIKASSALLEALGEDAPPPGRDSNDDNDLEMIAALWVNAVDFLVTDDIRLRRRAAKAALDSRVFTIPEAAALLERLAPGVATPPPAVHSIKAYQLDAADPIFVSLREDYAGFDVWLRKAQAEHRPAWIIRSDRGYAAVMIAKEEPAAETGLSGRVLKVSTFKVADDAAGRSYGELLLKALFGHAHASGFDSLYVTAYPRHERLIDLLQSFGFNQAPSSKPDGEIMLVKVRRPAVLDGLPPLEAHRRFGPPFVHPASRAFVVPITPNWHDALFPDYPIGLDIWTGVHAYGNGLRKAYVSGSKSRLVEAGDTLLFYRSSDLQGVTVIGVVEGVRVSTDPEAIGRFVGRRTVYSAQDLTRMSHEHEELHAMSFRQDRLIEPSWSLRSLRLLGVLNGPPQSITEVRQGGRAWLHQQLAASQ